MPIVCIMPMLFVVVYGAYSIYDAYEHNKCGGIILVLDS